MPRYGLQGIAVQHTRAGLAQARRYLFSTGKYLFLHSRIWTAGG